MCPVSRLRGRKEIMPACTGGWGLGGKGVDPEVYWTQRRFHYSEPHHGSLLQCRSIGSLLYSRQLYRPRV